MKRIFLAALMLAFLSGATLAGPWPTDNVTTVNVDAATDDPSQARAEIYNTMLRVKDVIGARGSASGVAGLDASALVPLANIPATLTGKSADMVDGYHAGNAAGQVPVSNGTVNATLNADTVDGLHASSFALLTGATFTGDITTYRAGSPTTGVLYLGNNGSTRYLFYDGSSYVMPGANLTINAGLAWHSLNDGAGSGLDADLLDGISSASFARVDAVSNFTSAPTISGNAIRHNGNIFHGRLNGNASVDRLPAGWTAAYVSPSLYTVTHGLATNAYTVVAISSNNNVIGVNSRGVNSFQLAVNHNSNVASDGAVYFILILD